MSADAPTSSTSTSLLRHNGRNRRSIRFLFCLFFSIIVAAFEVHRRFLRSTTSLLPFLLPPLRDYYYDDEGGGSWTAPTTTPTTTTTFGDYAVVKEKKKEGKEEEEEEEEMRDDLLLAEILRGRVPFPNGVDRLRYRPGSSGLRMNSTEALRYCRVDPEHRRSHFGDGRGTMVGLYKTFVSASERHKLMYRNVPKSASR